MEPAKPTLKQIAEYGNLLIAHANAKKGKGHYKAVKLFEKRSANLLHKLEQSILSGDYKTSRYVNKTITDGRKERIVSKLPYYPDRIAQWALMLQLEPVFMRLFNQHTHAAIPGRGIHTALYQTRYILLHYPEEARYCLKMDVKKYFQNIDHDILKQKIRTLTDDDALIQHLYENIDSFPQGIPIGNYTSQYWANLYLTDFDNMLTDNGFMFVRYMDDIIIFGRSARELHDVKKWLCGYLRDNLKLAVKENWQIFPTDKRAVDFVGYKISRNKVLLRKSTFKKLRRRMARVTKETAAAGMLSSHNRSVIASYSGWVRYCTPKARNTLFKNYFKPALDVITDEEFKEKIRKLLTWKWN